jgi:hypothetical protein
MVVPPQPLLPTYLRIDPESQKGAAKEGQPPGDSTEKRAVIRYAHGCESTALSRLGGAIDIRVRGPSGYLIERVTVEGSARAGDVSRLEHRSPKDLKEQHKGGLPGSFIMRVRMRLDWCFSDRTMCVARGINTILDT